jgi:putative ABC transport system substrate-binding protein
MYEKCAAELEENGRRLGAGENSALSEANTTDRERMQFDRLRRRDFIRLLGGVAAWPLAEGAQQPSNKPLHVGTAQVGPRGRPQMVAFEQRLRELGYVEGKNLSLEFINVEGQLDRYGDAMKELVRRNVDIV